jgi:hypothetical protein
MMKHDSSLLRVRAANPFPDISDAKADELFARITALRPATRPTRRTHRRRLLIVAVALVAVAVLASTAFAISRWVGGDVVKPNITLAEYRAAQRVLPLPPGDTWPVLHVQWNSVTTRGGGGGHAVAIAQTAWECYWAKAIRSGDARAQARAHGELNDLMRNNILVAPSNAPEDWVPANPPRGPYAVFADDGGYEFKQHMYALAAAGHAKQLAQSCTANGPG